MKKTNIIRERERFEKRKAAGEPVVFYKNHCCFDAGVVLAGYVPGPYPGLACYSREGYPIDPEKFAQWLKDTEHERKLLGLEPYRCLFDDFYGDEKLYNITQNAFAQLGITNDKEYIKFMQQRVLDQVSYAPTGPDFWDEIVKDANRRA